MIPTMIRVAGGPPYEQHGTGPLRATSLLDVLAAAGAAAVSGQQFAFADRGGERTITTAPIVTAEQAESALGALRAETWSSLDGSPLDLLRGAGRMGSASSRARAVCEQTTIGDVVAYAGARAAPNLSMRWECGHPSSVPPALRYDTEPRVRWSHPGRTLLALIVVRRRLEIDIVGDARGLDSFVAEDVRPQTYDITRFIPARSRRQWPVPVTPMTYLDWEIALDGRHAPYVQWYASSVAPSGQTLALRSEGVPVSV